MSFLARFLDIFLIPDPLDRWVLRGVPLPSGSCVAQMEKADGNLLLPTPLLSVVRYPLDREELYTPICYSL